jgi:hypothetical protein
MEPGQALALGFVIVLAILLIAAYYWYHQTGWGPFNFTGILPYVPGKPSACAGRESCVANNCVPPCTVDSDCPAAAAGACTSGLCPPTEGKTCCPIGEVLSGAQCKKVCASDGDCGSQGLGCWSGLCQPTATPSWVAKGGKNVASLRYKGCTFTVVDPAGATHTADVTSVLNGMAVAYRGSASKIPLSLRLDRPLNAFSFLIPGVNDRATVTTADMAGTWVNCATTLTGEVRTI